MSEAFRIIDADAWPIAEDEPGGGDEKDWLLDNDGSKWLFKPRTDQVGWSQGEDWAEKVSSALAAQLGVGNSRWPSSPTRP